jgi:hypothetical protein
MHSFLKQSTAAQSRSIGPFVDDTDFKTAETGLTIANTDIKLMINGAASANKNSGGGTHRANGAYGITFDATDTATVGEIFLSVVVAGALPVFATFVVLEEAVYDMLFGASAIGYIANQPVDLNTIKTQTVTAAAGVTFPTSIASPTNITAGTITTATNVTTVNGLAAAVITAASIAGDAITASKIADGAIDAATFAAGAINAAAIAADAITDAKVAADVTIASVTGAVGSVTGAVGSVTGNVGGNVTGSVGSLAAQAKADVNAEVDSALDTAIPGTPTAGSINDVLKDLDAVLPASAIATATNVAAVETDTQDIQSRLPAALHNGNIKADVKEINDVTIVGDGSGTPFNV